MATQEQIDARAKYERDVLNQLFADLDAMPRFPQSAAVSAQIKERQDRYRQLMAEYDRTHGLG